MNYDLKVDDVELNKLILLLLLLLSYYISANNINEKIKNHSQVPTI